VRTNDWFRMTKAFFLHFWHDLHRETIIGMAWRMYPAIQWLVTQIMLMMAINVAVPESNKNMLLGLATGYVISVSIWHFSVNAFENLRLGGKSRMILRRALVSTMIQLTNQAAEDYPSGECLSIMAQAVEDATMECWTGIIGLWGSFVQLVVITGLNIYSCRRMPLLIIIPFAMMAIDSLVLWMRVEKQVEKFAKFEAADNLWKASVIEMVEARSAITTYRSGYAKEVEFAEMNKVSNQQRFNATKYKNNTEKILTWLHTMFIVVTFVLTGLAAASKEMDVGDFVVIVNSVNKFDSEISKFFDRLFGTVTGFVSVKKISSMLNAPTRRKQLLQGRQRRVRILTKLREEDPEFQFHPQAITVYNVEFDYKHRDIGNSSKYEPKYEPAKTKRRECCKWKSEEVPADQPDWQEEGVGLEILKDGEEMAMEGNLYVDLGHIGPFNMVLEQGQIICIQGGGSTGKKTLLKLLARFLLPSAGIVWYPENLRVRYVAEDPILFNMSLMENLKFGNQKPHTVEEIWECCRIFGLSQKLLGKADLKVGYRGVKISMSDRIIVSICRAFLSSVDLLLLSNSLDMLGIEDSTACFEAMRCWVENRGLPCLSQENPEGVSTALKKRKTAFFVSKSVDMENQADAIINIASSSYDDKVQGYS